MKKVKTAESGENSPTSRRALAKLIGCNEATIRRRQEQGGCPDFADVEGWRKLIAETKSAGGQSYHDLRNEKLAAEIRLLKLKEQQAHGKLVEVEEVRGFLARLGAKFDQLLTQKLDTEIPARLLGKDIVAARGEARTVHDEIREIVNGGLSKWEPTT